MTDYLTAETFHAENFYFKLFKDKDGKQQNIRLLSKNGSRPIIKTPWLIAPFSFSSYSRNKAKESTEPVTDWTVDLKAACYESLDISALQGETYDHAKNAELIQLLFGELEKLQSMLVDFIYVNAKVLLKKGNWDKPTIETLFLQPVIIKGEPNKETGEVYPYRIRTKVMKKSENEGAPDITIQDLSGKELPVNSWEDIEKVVVPVIPKGKAMRSFIFLRPYYISATSKIGISIKLCTVQSDTRKAEFASSLKFEGGITEKLKLYVPPVTEETEENANTLAEDSDMDV